MHFIRFRLSSVHKRATSTVGNPLTCGNKRDMAAARGRKAPSKLGLAVKGFAWQLTTPQGKEKLRMAFSGSPSGRELWVFCAFARSQVVRFSMRPPRSTISECCAQNSTRGDYALEALGAAGASGAAGAALFWFERQRKPNPPLIGVRLTV